MEVDAIEIEWWHYDLTAMLDQSLILYLEDQARRMRAKGAAPAKVPNFMSCLSTNGLQTVRPDAVRIVERRE